MDGRLSIAECAFPDHSLRANLGSYKKLQAQALEEALNLARREALHPPSTAPSQRPHLNLVCGEALSHTLENAQDVWIVTVHTERVRSDRYLPARSRFDTGLQNDLETLLCSGLGIGDYRPCDRAMTERTIAFVRSVDEGFRRMRQSDLLRGGNRL